MNRYQCFYDYLSKGKANNVALIYDDNSKKISLTYAELKKLVDEYHLSDKSSVGILCENNLKTIVSMFAYARVKRQIVLLNANDDVSILKKEIEVGDVSFLEGSDELIAQLSSSLLPDKGIDNNGNILFFTSGTTSSNKAVILSEQSLCASAYNGSALLPLKEEDVLLSILPFNHVFGFVCSLLWAFSSNSSVALTRGYRYLFSDLAYFNVSAVSLVPQMASFIVDNNYINKELRLVLIGAANCSKDIVKKFQDHSIFVSCGYGLTESSSGVALSINKNVDELSICPLCKIKIAADDEILIKDDSPCLMKGYYKDNKATKDVLFDGYFHTGDLGRIDEKGYLHLIGRKKDILLLDDGTKIYCSEYENELIDLLNEKDLAVTLIDNKIVLIVNLVNKNCDIFDKIQEFNLVRPLNQRISKIKIVDKPLERTETGKIKRYQLGVDYHG